MKIRLFVFAVLAMLTATSLASCASNNGLAKRKPRSSCNCPHF